jgi:hypothetical protein
MTSADLLRDLLVIERRLAEKLREEGNPTVRGYCKSHGFDDYGVWISTHGVIVEVDPAGHYAAAKAMLTDVGLYVGNGGRPLVKMGFIRVVYSGEFIINIYRIPTEAQYDALAKIVRRARSIEKDRRIATLDLPCKLTEVRADIGTIRSAIESGCT